MSTPLPRLDHSGTKSFRLASGVLAGFTLAFCILVPLAACQFWVAESPWKDWWINISAGIPALIIALMLERRFRRPMLAWTENVTLDIPHIPSCQWLGVNIGNAPNLKCIESLYSRETAVDCEALVAFFCTCGKPLFATEFNARWANAYPEPFRIQVGPNATYLLNDIKQINIRPGRAEAVHFLIIRREPFDVFLWSNDSYRYPNRLDAEHRILVNEFIVRLRICVAGEVSSAVFRIDSNGGFNNVTMTMLDPEFEHRFRLPGEQ